jgi:membrane fusion protein, multidrug efflux system
MSKAWRLIAVAAVVAGCSKSAGSEVPAAEGDAANVRTVNVEVAVVQPEAFLDQVGITGTVEAERDVVVSAEESGVVREVFVEKGRAVRSGQPLLRVDDRILRAQHDQARAEADLARETYERQRRLWEEEKIGSELTYLQARYRAETADANVRALAARLERTVVRAPVTGVMEARMVEVGSMVAPGTPVARIIDVDTLKVSGGVPERYAGEIRAGTAARVLVDNIGGREFSGSARFVGNAVNEQNRTFPVEISIPNSGGMLKPGMVARVQLTRGASRDALMVPREAVLRTEAGYAVFTVHDEDGRMVARSTPVITGPGSGNRVVVESGLNAGDRVVVVGQHQVTHGDIVRTVPREAAGS